MAVILVSLCGISSFVGIDVAGAGSPLPKLSMERARTLALSVAPGVIIHAELENENGEWRYSFDIQLKDQTREVGIDANSGTVVENSVTSPAKRD